MYKYLDFFNNNQFYILLCACEKNLSCLISKNTLYTSFMMARNDGHHERGLVCDHIS